MAGGSSVRAFHIVRIDFKLRLGLRRGIVRKQYIMILLMCNRSVRAGGDDDAAAEFCASRDYSAKVLLRGAARRKMMDIYVYLDLIRGAGKIQTVYFDARAGAGEIDINRFWRHISRQQQQRQLAARSTVYYYRALSGRFGDVSAVAHCLEFFKATFFHLVREGGAAGSHYPAFL